MLFQQLDLSGLDGWSDRNQAAAWVLSAEYHDIFSLEPGELSCIDVAKHEIRFFDDQPFKERFQRIPPLMVDELCAHKKEMLYVVTIHSSQSPQCNMVVLVCKKDYSLPFHIDFCKLNARTKKDSYPLPQIEEAIESLDGAWCFSCLDLKVGFWQIATDETSKQYTAFTMGILGCFECTHMPFGVCNAPAACDSLLEDGGGALAALVCCVWSLPGTQPEAKTH